MRNGAANNHPARFWSFGAWSPATESAVLSTLRAGRATALVVVMSASSRPGVLAHTGGRAVENCCRLVFIASTPAFGDIPPEITLAITEPMAVWKSDPAPVYQAGGS